MKKIVLVFTVLIFITFVFIQSYAESEDIKVSVNNEIIDFDVRPIIFEGRTLVPVRTIFEAFGITVEWDNSTKTVVGIKDDVRIELPINRKIAKINNEQIILDVPAMIINGRTLVPTRFIGESIGAEVKWDGVKRTVIINTLEPRFNKNYTTELDIDPIGEYRGWIYYYNSTSVVLDNSSLHRIRNNGENDEVVFKNPVHLLHITNDKLYFIDRNSRKLFVSNLDGTNMKKLIDDVIGNYFEAKVFDDYIYYINSSDQGKLYKVKLNGTDRKKISNDTYAKNLRKIDDWIYYISLVNHVSDVPTFSYNGNNTFVTNVTEEQINNSKSFKESYLAVFRVNEEGTEKIKIAEYLYAKNGCAYYDVKGDWLYFSNENDNKTLYKVKTDGTGLQKVCDIKNISIEKIHKDWIYFTDFNMVPKKNKPDTLVFQRKLYRLNLDNNQLETLENENAWEVNIKDDWIYYTDQSHVLTKIKLDGSNKIRYKKDFNDETHSFVSIVGDYIYFVRYNGASLEGVYKMPLDFSKKIRLRNYGDKKY